MNSAIILADGESLSLKDPADSHVINLQTYGKDKNIRIEIDALRTGLLRDMPRRLDDLVSIAAIVYSADTRLKRGTEKDVFRTRWKRNISAKIPVHDYDYWNTDIKDDLSDTLEFLTEDNWKFQFTQKDASVPVQRFLFKEKIGELPKVTTIISFSGGVDSLAATIDAFLSGKRPLLISHRAAPIISARQINLVNQLRSCFDNWPFPHISMWVNRRGGNRAIENTQRSRAFVYTCLSVVAACLLDIDDVLLCDNGIVSINLPQSGQTIGSDATRSTHPTYIHKVQGLLKKISDRAKLSIKNTLFFHTKKEAMEIIRKSGFPELLQETNSCSHTEGMTNFQPHCGVCSQCIDRRFSSIAAELQPYDLKERYLKDVFTSDLKEGFERTYAENYVRFVNKLSTIPTADAFFSEHPQLLECLGDDNIEDTAIGIFEMYQRHLRDVSRVIEDEIKNHVTDLLSGSLPENSLIKIVATGKHLLDIKVEYIKKLRSILKESIPIAFNRQKAKDETHVQDVGQAVLIAAKERLYRESPQIPFATISTKPDFSQLNDNGNSLFLEFKHIKERKRLNSITTDMTSRVTIYRSQGAWVLFVVHDPNRSIVEDQKFISSFEKYENIFVALVR